VAAAAKGNLVVKLLGAKPTADDKKAVKQAIDERKLDRFQLALLGALSGIEFNNNLWDGQDTKTGATGSASETLRRLRAVDAAYWVAQGPN
jgi:hypothetical protein